MEIVLDTQDLCWDFGTITRVNREGEVDEIKVVRTDGYTYYIATPDRDQWQILDGFSESDLPADWTPSGYYYINSEWVKNEPPVTGDTQNNI